MNDASFLGLVHNAALLLAMALIFDISGIALRDERRVLQQILFGIIVGAMGIMLMMTPWVLVPGIIFDTRSVLLGISGVFFGAIPTIIAMAMTAAFRLFQGGAATRMGVSVILVTGAIGIAWRLMRRRQVTSITMREFYLFGIVIHLAMLAMAFTLPWPTTQQVLSAIALPVMVIYPVGTALLGKLVAVRLHREQISKDLHESQDRLRLAVQTAGLGFFEVNLLTKQEYYSPEWKQQLGFANKEIVDDGREWQTRVHPEDLEETLIRENDFIAGLRPNYESVFRLRHKNGSYRWILSRGLLQYNERGRAVHLLGCHIDITRQKEDEAAIAASERRFRGLAESSQDYIMLYDRECRHVYENPAGLRASGLSAGDIIGKTHREAGFSLEQSDMWEADIRQVIATGASTQRLFEWESAAGKVFLDWRLSPVLDQHGKVELVLGISRDVTALKQAEEALRTQEEQYRVLTESIQDVVWIFDTETMYFRYVSPSVERLRGYTADEIIALPVDHALTPQTGVFLMEEIRSRVKDLLSGEAPPGTFYVNEVEQPCKDGTTVWTEAITNFYVNKINGHVEVRGVSRDISARKQAEDKLRSAHAELKQLLDATEHSRLALLDLVEEQKKAQEQIRVLNAELERRVQERTAQLEAANKELEAFAYSVSHDLRAPLRAIEGFGSVLMTSYAEKLDEQGQHYLQRIQEACQRMGHLINDLLGLSRVTRTEIKRQKVDLSALASDIAAALRSQDPERQIEFDICPNLVVEGDSHLLRIALENLLNNAYKFTSRRDRAAIAFGATEQNGKKVFFVRDNGVGFEMAYANKLFAPFQRLHRTDDFPGTGIGLVTVQRIITRHGGRIWPEAAPDQGATFFFTIGDSTLGGTDA